MLELVDRRTEEGLRDAIDPAELERHVDAFTGLTRVSGTDDEWEASEYVVETLESYGVDATLHEFEAYISVPESGSVTVTTPTRREMTEAITTSFGASTPDAGLHGEVVHVPEVSPESLSAHDVEDRIVLTTGLPTPGPIRDLEAAGVRAVIFESVNPDHLHEMIVTPVWGTPGVDDVDDIPDLPVVEVSQADGAWLRERCREGPVEATVRTSVTTELATLPCPVGRIEGSESDRCLVIGNHVDSWYEGVTDNATAMAATLEIARLFADRNPRRGLVFGFWPGHSTGRYAGSAWYADEHWLDLRENAVSYLHLDLNGLRGAEGIWYQHMAELGDEHMDAIASATDLPTIETEDAFMGARRPARNSDQSFWGAGASSLLSGARLTPGTEEGGVIGGGWWWHTPEDTRDKVDLDVLVEETKLYVTLAARMCESPVLPHEFAATAADVREELSAIERAGEVEFPEVHERLDTFESLANRAADALDGLDPDDEDALRDAEDLQVDLGNTLVPAVYMAESEYEHDPALPHERLPYLRVAAELPERTGREQRFAETTVRRGRNKLCHRFDRASARVERFLAEYE